MNRSWLKLLLPVLLFVGGIVYCTRGPGPDAAVATAPSSSGSAVAGVSPLLDGLAVGSTVGEWTLDRVAIEPGPNKAPQLCVDLSRKGSGVSVWIARKETAQNPPITTAKYALSYGHERSDGEPIPPDAAEKLANELSARIRKTEQGTPVPAGL